MGRAGELKITIVESDCGGGVRVEGAPLRRPFLICCNCHYRELDGIHFYDEGINGYGENRVQVEDLNPKKGIKP